MTCFDNSKTSVGQGYWRVSPDVPRCLRLSLSLSLPPCLCFFIITGSLWSRHRFYFCLRLLPFLLPSRYLGEHTKHLPESLRPLGSALIESNFLASAQRDGGKVIRQIKGGSLLACCQVYYGSPATTATVSCWQAMSLPAAASTVII